MKKKHYDFVKNIGLFTICSFSQRILSFLLLPIYTSYLSTEQYGIIDLTGTVVNLLIPVLTISIADGVLVYTMDDPENKGYLKYAFKIYSRGISVLCILGIMALMIPYVRIPPVYIMWCIVIFIGQSINVLYFNYLRGISGVSTMVLVNTVGTAITLLLRIVFVVFLKMNINGYLLAGVIGTFSGILIIEVKEKPVLSAHKAEDITQKQKKELIKYSFPQIFSALSWWVNSSLDRIFITAILGVSQNGIYSIAFKIPNILGIFEQIFSQAWLLSSVKEFNKEDEDGYFGNMFQFYNASLVIVCSVILLLNIRLTKILYASHFFEAWKYAPVLLLCTLFMALNSFMGSICRAAKKTKFVSITSIISALVNTCANALLIPVIGLLGAGLATLLGYVLVYIIMLFYIRKWIDMKLDYFKIACSHLLLMGQVVLASQSVHAYPVQICILLLFFCLFYKIYLQLGTTVVRTIKLKLKK